MFPALKAVDTAIVVLTDVTGARIATPVGRETMRSRDEEVAPGVGDVIARLAVGVEVLTPDETEIHAGKEAGAAGRIVRDASAAAIVALNVIAIIGIEMIVITRGREAGAESVVESLGGNELAVCEVNQWHIWEQRIVGLSKIPFLHGW